MAAFHLAQLNIGRTRAPVDSPLLAEFTEALDTINALADESPGFVWRLQTDDGNATGIKVFDDDLLIINMSVWESIEELREFVYRSEHRRFLARRREWFDHLTEAFLVLWWVPSGHIPTIDEAIERLELLRAEGPSPRAFTFRSRFPAPVLASDGQATQDTSDAEGASDAKGAEVT